jgi:two-component system, NarL family, response regulator DevR
MNALTELPSQRFAPDTVAPIRCLVVDDHPAIRVGLRDLLADQPGLEVLEAVATAEAAVSFAQRHELDVAIVDYQLGGRNGLWVSRKLKRLPRPPAVLIYSAYSDYVLAAACVVAEVDGLVSKAQLGSDLYEAIRDVARGKLRLPALPSSLAATLRRRLDTEEQAIFGMLLAGIATEQIAVTLGVSPAGLEHRLRAMLRKLDALDTVR